MSPSKVPRVLSIAGSDSGGGAGIQADLKAFAVCAVHGMTAITAVTAQNTVDVSAVYELPRDVIVAQVRAVHDDIGVDAVKIGMVGDVERIEAVAEALEMLPAGIPIVLDPVLVAESGAELLDPSARGALVELLMPKATVTTPNVAEACALAGPPDTRSPGTRSPDTRSPRELVRAIHALGPQAVVLTGGHLQNPTDTFFDGERVVEIPGERYPDGAAHGSGCTHSAALAAWLAWGHPPLTAAIKAKAVASAAVRDGLRDVGQGAGPVDALGLAARSTTSALT